MNRETPEQATPARTEQRVSTLIGDRLCTKCFYNLTGQAVLREPHYEMLIVRCPECGTVASVQEYPLLGRWSQRWAMLAAGMWGFMMIIFAVFTALLFIGAAEQTSNLSARPLAIVIAEEYLEWVNAQPAGTPAAAMAMQWGTQQASPHTVIDPTWWSQQDPDAFFAKAGGYWGGVEWWTIADQAFWWSLVFIAFGSLWAVAAPHRRRWHLLFLAATIASLAGSMLFIGTSFARMQPTMWGWMQAIQAAEPIIELPFEILTFVYCTIVFSIGLLIGRKVARRVLRWLLPPRLCSSLSYLWIADGLDPPRVAAPAPGEARDKAGR